MLHPVTNNNVSNTNTNCRDFNRHCLDLCEHFTQILFCSLLLCWLFCLLGAIAKCWWIIQQSFCHFFPSSQFILLFLRRSTDTVWRTQTKLSLGQCCLQRTPAQPVKMTLSLLGLKIFQKYLVIIQGDVVVCLIVKIWTIFHADFQGLCFISSPHASLRP